MATYTALQGQMISDCVLNSTGVPSNWGAILDANNFDTWTPDLYSGQILQIPDTAELNQDNIATLSNYPANNFVPPEVYEQIDTIFGIIAGAAGGIVSVFDTPIIDTTNYYMVRAGECFVDVIENATSDIANWDLILNANPEFTDRNPLLFSGQKVIIPPGVNMNLNGYRALNTYPANNNSVPDVYAQINAIFELILNPTEDWILYNPDGVWNDTAHYWRDGGVWLDD